MILSIEKRFQMLLDLKDTKAKRLEKPRRSGQLLIEPNARWFFFGRQ